MAWVGRNYGQATKKNLCFWLSTFFQYFIEIHLYARTCHFMSIMNHCIYVPIFELFRSVFESRVDTLTCKILKTTYVILPIQTGSPAHSADCLAHGFWTSILYWQLLCYYEQSFPTIIMILLYLIDANFLFKFTLTILLKWPH